MAVDVRTEGLERVEVLKALAEPLRWRIVERLSAEELCVCHLVDELGIAQPLVSHHLKVLREAGIVESERFRQWVYYRVRPEALAGAAKHLVAISRRTGRAGARRRPCC